MRENIEVLSALRVIFNHLGNGGLFDELFK